jgi:hypothetical protein
VVLDARNQHERPFGAFLFCRKLITINILMRRSTCLLTLPRSGSEVLLHHLECSRNLQWAGEFLTLDTVDYPQAVKVSDTGIFLKDWKTVPTPSSIPQIEFIPAEFNRRLEILENYRKTSGPLVVKSFVGTYMQGLVSLEQVCDLFDIVILSRKDKWRSILSYFICRHTGIWHETDSEKIQDAKQVINETRIVVDEGKFFRQVQSQNFLTLLQRNIHKLQKNAISLYYENFSNDPITDLNRIFINEQSANTVIVSKLIDNHESLIVNADRLREIYDKFILEL